jgi:dynein regulatory complex protein 1
MEDMKAVYKLNEEKLEFNHKVLADRDKVNKSVQESLKKRERRLKNTKIQVQKNFYTQKKIYEQNNKRMTKDYKRFTKEYLALQKKYERFEKSDKTRFDEIWSMNEKEVRDLCDKI